MIFIKAIKTILIQSRGQNIKKIYHIIYYINKHNVSLTTVIHEILKCILLTTLSVQF